MLFETNGTISEVATEIHIQGSDWKHNISYSFRVTNIIELTLTTPCLFLNSIIVFAICYIKRLHTTPNFFIASLAGSDIVFACVNSACGIAGLQQRYTNEPILECVESFLTMTSLLSSHCCHLIISVERWLYIARPYLHQRIVTHRSSACTVIIAWIISCAVGTRIVIDCDPHGPTEMVDMGIVDPCVHFLLSITMFSIYAHIAVITKRQIKAIKTMTYVSDPNTISETEKILQSLRTTWSTLRMLVTVSGTYFLLLTPQVCLNIYVHAKRDRKIYGSAMSQCARILSVLHSYCIFFVYARQDKDFKHALGKCWSRLGFNCCNRQVSPDKHGAYNSS